MTASVQAAQDAFANIPEEDRLYPLPLNAPSELGKPESKREFKIAQGMGAVRLPGAGFLVCKPELDEEAKDRLRHRFGGASNKRKRDDALRVMKAERETQRVVEGEARTATGERQRNYLYTTPGEEGAFAIEGLKALAKDQGVKLEWDPTLRLRYLIGEQVPEAFDLYRTDAAREAYEQAFGVRAEKQVDARAETVEQGVNLARKIVESADTGLTLPDPAVNPRGFSQRALNLSDMTAKELSKRIRDTAAVLVERPGDEATVRSLRVAFAVYTGAADKPVDDQTLVKIGLSRDGIPPAALDAPRPDEKRLLAVAYGWDQVKQKSDEARPQVVTKPKPTGRAYSIFSR